MEYICPECNEKRPDDDYELRNDTERTRPECKFCHYAYIKECKENNPEKYKERNRIYRELNKDKIKQIKQDKEYKKQYRETHKEQIQASRKKYNKTPEQKLLATQKRFPSTIPTGKLKSCQLCNIEKDECQFKKVKNGRSNFCKECDKKKPKREPDTIVNEFEIDENYGL